MVWEALGGGGLNPSPVLLLPRSDPPALNLPPELVLCLLEPEDVVVSEVKSENWASKSSVLEGEVLDLFLGVTEGLVLVTPLYDISSVHSVLLRIICNDKEYTWSGCQVSGVCKYIQEKHQPVTCNLYEAVQSVSIQIPPGSAIALRRCCNTFVVFISWSD